ncbi:Octaprenyl diphosphate synthase / Dimethylallyltransferase / Geranyltranstransferase / Geranylgeranyl diphosphate synthase [Alloactinosynnema sp. L-07]|uniref:polyprenyl synthetase family protein n=1 Tax=Alloactinosynnema sp. L-07 TaxID=1653480 RepID=UPI00065EF8DB|nr:polyprenyl synthetase family protein [Alloactinosynnema sp. L-07]CRK61655.1 Octaprenyl diphosphate synthase / Dimethylallyltransferase / Geranyltranstransferase / Geranylgeranyl diphosphate synthase [Alloactinosynnema sp. L-07]
MTVPAAAPALGTHPGVAMARHLTTPALVAAIDRLGGRLTEVCGYQLGIRDEHGRHTATVGGKLLRPAFTLLSAVAAGGAPRAAVPAAVAIELLHNASLVHDDIMDGDRTRRGRPTVWAHYGVPLAILAGDALIALGFEVLAETGSSVTPLARTLRLLALGQDSDLDFETRRSVSPSECLAMLTGKTGVLLGCACALGAASAGAPAEWVERFDRWGTHLGVAFQLVDDLLGIWGDPAVTGKPVGADLLSRKKSAPVVAALAADMGLAQLYARPGDWDAREVARVTGLIERTGAREWVRAEIDRRTELAWAELAGLDLDPSARRDLRTLTTALAIRDH